VAVDLNDFPCFPKALCVVDALHGWEMAADYAASCSLEGLAISSGESKGTFGQFFSTCLDQVRLSLT